MEIAQFHRVPHQENAKVIQREDATPHINVGKDIFMANTTHTAPRESLQLPVDPDFGNDEKVFDRAELLQRAGGDVDLAAEILDLCPSELTKMIHELEIAVAKKDAEQIQRAAHRLKGTLGNIGAARAFAAALRLEDLGCQGEFTHVEATFLAVRQHVERVKLAIATTGKS